MRPQISQSFSNSYMEKVDNGLGDDARVDPTFALDISISPSVPTIYEIIAFNPLLDPLAEQPFDDTFTEISTSDISSDSLEDEKPHQCFCLRRCPVHLMKKLESELWAALLGFCGEY